MTNEVKKNGIVLVERGSKLGRGGAVMRPPKDKSMINDTAERYSSAMSRIEQAKQLANELDLSDGEYVQTKKIIDIMGNLYRAVLDFHGLLDKYRLADNERVPLVREVIPDEYCEITRPENAILRVITPIVSDRKKKTLFHFDTRTKQQSWEIIAGIQTSIQKKIIDYVHQNPDLSKLTGDKMCLIHKRFVPGYQRQIIDCDNDNLDCSCVTNGIIRGLHISDSCYFLSMIYCIEEREERGYEATLIYAKDLEKWVPYIVGDRHKTYH